MDLAALMAQAQEKIKQKQEEEQKSKEVNVENDLTARESSIGEAKKRDSEINQLSAEITEAKQQVFFAEAEISQVDAAAETLKAAGMEEQLNALYEQKRTVLTEKQNKAATTEAGLKDVQDQFNRAESTAENIVPARMEDTKTPDQIAARNALEDQAYEMNKPPSMVDSKEHVAAIVEDKGRNKVDSVKMLYDQEKGMLEQMDGRLRIEERIVLIEDLDKPENANLKAMLPSLNYAYVLGVRRAIPVLLEKGLIKVEDLHEALLDLSPYKLAEIMGALPAKTAREIAKDPSFEKVFEEAVKVINEDAEKVETSGRIKTYLDLMKVPLTFHKKVELGLNSKELDQAQKQTVRQIDEEVGYPAHFMNLVGDNLLNQNLETAIRLNVFTKEQVIGWFRKALKEIKPLRRPEVEERLMIKCMQLRDEGLLTPEESEYLLNPEIN
ncbi:MAG: hypothetical protein JWO40_698 [Candidatus Doudnabacteria bacterium]|nr:hypothetical protein [Candidatus Doudnabacteria bacterium]